MRRLAIGTWLLVAWAGSSHLIRAEEKAVQKRVEGSATASQKTTASPRAWSGPRRNWGPEQVIGPPDTPGSGDLVTAWASASQDDQAEWLICEFEKPLQAIFLHVHETYHPGALVKVTAFGPDGKEVTAWEGEDPTPRGEARGVSKIPIALGADAQRFKLHIDSPAVRGWNEIDAVAVEDETGKLHWAVKVEASSTFATGIVEVERPPRVIIPPPLSPLERLQQEVNDLKKREALRSEELRALREELRELKENTRSP